MKQQASLGRHTPRQGRRLLFLTMEQTRKERGLRRGVSPPPSRLGVWRSVVSSKFLSFGASRTPLPRLENNYWQYSRSDNAKKYWGIGAKLYSPQYLKKYCGKCPHCPYEVSAYAPRGKFWGFIVHVYRMESRESLPHEPQKCP